MEWWEERGMEPARLRHRPVLLRSGRGQLRLEALQRLVAHALDLSDAVAAVHLHRHQLRVGCDALSALRLLADLAPRSQLLLDLIQ